MTFYFYKLGKSSHGFVLGERVQLSVQLGLQVETWGLGMLGITPLSQMVSPGDMQSEEGSYELPNQ